MCIRDRCTACFAVCPKNAITMKPDEEGFMYPNINDEMCIRDRRILDFLYKILIVNLIFAILEYTMGYGLDAVTGLYSEGMHTAGGSAALNILMCIVCTHTVIQYLSLIHI